MEKEESDPEEELSKLSYSTKKEIIFNQYMDEEDFFKYFEKKITKKLILKFIILYVLLSLAPLILPLIIETRQFMIIFLLIVLLCVTPISLFISKCTVKRENLSEFATKRWITKFLIGLITLYFLITIVSIVLRYFDFYNYYLFGLAYVGIFCWEYLFYRRLKGAGLAHIHLTCLIIDFNSNPTINLHITKDYKEFLMSVDKWYSEEHGFRIADFSEIINKGYNIIASNLTSFQKQMQGLFDQFFNIKLEEYSRSENLSKIKSKLSKILGKKIMVKREPYYSSFFRFLRKPETITMIVFTLINIIIQILFLLFQH